MTGGVVLRVRVAWRLTRVVFAAAVLLYVTLLRVVWLALKAALCLAVMGLTTWLLYAGVTYGH